MHTKKGRPESRPLNAVSNNEDFPYSVKTLDSKFSKDGFHFEQLRREGNIALFRKRREHWREDEWTFEVLRIRTRKAEVINGRSYPARETLPGNEDWGTHGFSYNDESEALNRFWSMAAEGLQDDVGGALGTKDDTTPMQALMVSLAVDMEGDT